MYTQSTRSSQRINCGATGGMDDRFDLMLTSNTPWTGSNYVRYLPGSYDTLGNDPSIYNDNINDFWNASTVPDNILDALYYMSDHIPVILELEVTHPPTVSVQQLPNVDLQMNLYPNPATEQLMIQYTIPSSSSVRIAVVDMLGQVVFSRVVENQQGGNAAQLDIRNLPKGVYSLTIETNKGKQQKMFVKQ